MPRDPNKWLGRLGVGLKNIPLSTNCYVAPPTPPTASVGAGYSCHCWTTYHARGATVKPNLRWCCLLLLVWQICVWPVTTHCTDYWHWENGGLCALENVPLPQFTDSEYTFPQDLKFSTVAGGSCTRCVRSWPVGLLSELAQLEAWVLLLGLALFNSNWTRSGTSGYHMHFLAKQVYKGIVPFHFCVLVHPFGLRGRLKVGLELWKQTKVQNSTQ